jgi:predicted nucleic acid-binding protein
VSVLLDTGILYATYDRRDFWHARAIELVQTEPGDLIVPSPVIPEVDHLLGHRLGSGAREAFYRALAEGPYNVVNLPPEGHRRVLEIHRQFAALEIGFVDAAVIAIAEVLGLWRIATVDRRDFGAMTAVYPLVLLP